MSTRRKRAASEAEAYTVVVTDEYRAYQARFDAEREAADALYAGTVMRRYSEMRVSSVMGNTSQSAFTLVGWDFLQHPLWLNRGPTEGAGDGWGFNLLRTPEALASPIRYRSPTRRAERIPDIAKDINWGRILVSTRAEALLRELDPEAVDTYPVEVTLATGEVLPAGSYSLFDVVRRIEVVDLEASGWIWSPRLDGSLFLDWGKPDGNDVPLYLLRDTVPNGVHLFRDLQFDPGPIFASETVREAMIERGISGPGFAWGDRRPHTLSLPIRSKRRAR